MKLNAKHRIEVVGEGSRPHKKRGRCWLLHKWAAWGPKFIAELRVIPYFAGIPFGHERDKIEERQQRECRRCGLIQVRVIQ